MEDRPESEIAGCYGLLAGFVIAVGFCFALAVGYVVARWLGR